jgi:RHS repeat-associated protein
MTLLFVLLFSFAYSQSIPPLEGAPALSGGRNQVGSVSFDLSGSPIGKGRSYFNDLGKGTQSLSWDVLTGKVWASETLYDRHGRPALQTLSAPVGTGLTYSPDFILTGSGTSYGHQQFDLGGGIDGPAPVGTGSELGAFYSTANPNSYQDITSYPFVRTVYSRLSPGSTKKVLGGNKIDGEWKQSHSFTMPVGTWFNECLLFTRPGTHQGTVATKRVTRDVHGEDVVVFSDSDGNVLAAARSGIQDHKICDAEIEIGPLGYVDIHIAKGISNFSIDNPDPSISGPLKIYNLVTEAFIGSVSGTSYQHSVDPNVGGFFRISVGTPLVYGKALERSVAPAVPITVSHRITYYDFSINHYDRAGRLVASSQPAAPQGLVSTFSYNSLGQLLEATSPDEGTARFRYRKDGQIRFSQNVEQEAAGKFSYTHYDNLGRPVESGVYEGPLGFWNVNVDAADGLDDQYCREVHRTGYDLPDADLAEVLSLSGCPQLVAEYGQKFVAGNVARTSYTVAPSSFSEPTGTSTYSTWYSYDVQGRVSWTVQQLPGLKCPKTTDYRYDPATGQVVSVEYQRHDSYERFIHRYEYSAAGQLTKVFTSRTGQDNDWMEQASYEYAESGELVRTVIAEDLQGIDYVYNLNGQLKAINHPSLLPANDPGGDGTAGSGVAADVFGFAIDYYDGDYARTGTPTPVEQQNTHGTDQYNGNIKGVRFNTAGLAPGGGAFKSYMYGYDKNNWLSWATFGSGSVSAQGAGHRVNFTPDANGDYGVSGIEYDANGNLQSLVRKGYTGGGTNAMDEFQYSYGGGVKKNQLQYVRDTGDNSDPNRYDDLRDQYDGGLPNYIYNGLGQLVADVQGKMVYEYGASGLVTRINTFGNGGSGPQEFYSQDFGSGTTSAELGHWSLGSGTTGDISINYSGKYVPFGGSPSCTSLDDAYGRSLKLEVGHNGIAKREYDVIAGVAHTLDLDVVADQWGSSQLPVGYTLYVYNVGGIGAIPAPIATASYNTALAYIGSPSTTCGKFYERHESLSFTPTGDRIRVELKKVATGGQEPLYLDNITFAAQTVPVMDIAYNDRGQRAKKTVYNPANGNITTTYYVRDVSGTALAIYRGSVTGGRGTKPSLRELPLYGAGRLGVCTVADAGTIDGGGDSYHYQLTDHLGNVRAVVGRATNGTPFVVARTDYYPFGMPMPNRNVEGTYRYKFQGQEKDPETGMEAFELRMWDARIGRWLTTDPYGEFFSPYLGMGNNPIITYDTDGGRIIVGMKLGTDSYRYEYRNGNFYDPKTGELASVPHQFFLEIKTALNQIASESYGAAFINTLQRVDDEYVISYIENVAETLHNRVRIDPKKKIETYLTNGLANSPFFVTLAHELGHAYGNVNGETKGEFWYHLGGKDVAKDEIYASSIENMIRKEQGLNLRKYYSHYTNTRKPYEPSLLLHQTMQFLSAPVFFNQNNTFGGERVLTPRFF